MKLNDTTSTTSDTRHLARPEGRIGYDVAGTAVSLRRPGYARAFSLTTRTSHAAAEVALGRVAVPVLVTMGDRDPDLGDPAGEAAWIAAAVGAQGVMVPEAGHYPQSQRPDLTAGAVPGFLAAAHG
jgi:pimeloyl-ACP methyl ester carboxylesterase